MRHQPGTGQHALNSMMVDAELVGNGVGSPLLDMVVAQDPSLQFGMAIVILWIGTSGWLGDDAGAHGGQTASSSGHTSDNDAPERRSAILQGSQARSRTAISSVGRLVRCRHRSRHYIGIAGE